MNIALFDAAPYWSGGAERVYLCAQGFLEHGQKVIVICLPTSRLNQLLEGKVKLYHVRPLSDISPFALIRIIFILRKEKIDILDVHSPKFYWLALFAAKILKKKLVITRNVSYRKKGLKKWINSFLYRSCDKVVAVCNQIKKDFLADFKISEDKIVVIYDGLKPLNFSAGEVQKQRTEIRAKYNVSESEILLVNINRIERNKAQDLLIRSMELLKNRGYNLKVLIVGKVEDRKFFQELKELAKKFKESVFFVGFQENILPYILAADLVISSSYHEALPRNILQALIYGVPVVSTAVGGLRELFDEKLLKFSTENTAESIAAAIAEVIKNIAHYREELKKLDRTKFAYSRMVEEYLKVYQML